MHALRLAPQGECPTTTNRRRMAWPSRLLGEADKEQETTPARGVAIDAMLGTAVNVFFPPACFPLFSAPTTKSLIAVIGKPRSKAPTSIACLPSSPITTQYLHCSAYTVHRQSQSRSPCKSFRWPSVLFVVLPYPHYNLALKRHHRGASPLGHDDAVNLRHSHILPIPSASTLATLPTPHFPSIRSRRRRPSPAHGTTIPDELELDIAL
jgi:hypothetical protein